VLQKAGKEVVVSVQVGDRIRIESERAGQTGRAGLVEEVLSEQPQRLRVRWEDGRTSIFAPAAGVARFEPPARPGQRKKPTA
jgi:Domain of unknown function (DUF1918)